MRYILSISFALILTSCAQPKVNAGHNATENEIYKSWVLSRCLSYAFPNGALNQDALNSASAYLEQSELTVEAFIAADPLIKNYLEKSRQGSITGSFKVKSCVDLYHSPELEQLFLKEKNKQ